MVLEFDANLLSVLVGSHSVIDLPGLHLKSTQQAFDFIKAYGFDLSLDEDRAKIKYIYRRALVFLIQTLGFEESKIPDAIKDLDQTQNIENVLLWASQTSLIGNTQDLDLASTPSRELQKWSCAILRVMHAFVHAENDLFHFYSEEVQKQILTPFEEHVVSGGDKGRFYLRHPNDGINEKSIELCGFEVKPYKTSVSSVLKLLAKHDVHMMSLYDKIGVRFVTQTLTDAFRVLQYLINHNILSLAHIMSGQTSNNLFPVDLFIKMAGDFAPTKWKELSAQEIDQFLLIAKKEYMANPNHTLFPKENIFSSPDYEFMKFVTRKLIKISGSGFQFFYPFEVQIMTQNGYKSSFQGSAEHGQYKKRQISAAKKRVFPEL